MRIFLGRVVAVKVATRLFWRLAHHVRYAFVSLVLIDDVESCQVALYRGPSQGGSPGTPKHEVGREITGPFVRQSTT